MEKCQDRREAYNLDDKTMGGVLRMEEQGSPDYEEALETKSWNRQERRRYGHMRNERSTQYFQLDPRANLLVAFLSPL